MNPDVELELQRSPSALLWMVIIFVLGVSAFAAHSLILAICTGLAMGYYHGNYRGRIAVLRAWRHDLEAERKEIESELTPCKD